MSDRAFVGGTIHVAQPEVFVEEVGSGVGVFVWRDRPFVFRFMPSFG